MSHGNGQVLAARAETIRTTAKESKPLRNAKQQLESISAFRQRMEKLSYRVLGVGVESNVTYPPEVEATEIGLLPEITQASETARAELIRIYELFDALESAL